MLLIGSDFKNSLKRKVEEDSSDGIKKNCPLQLRRREVWAELREYGIRMEILLTPRSEPLGTRSILPSELPSSALTTNHVTIRAQE